METARRCSSVTDWSRLLFAFATPAAFCIKVRSRLPQPTTETIGWKNPAYRSSSVTQWQQHEHATTPHRKMKRLAALESALRLLTARGGSLVAPSR